MKPKLVPHKRRVLLRAYSMWAVYLSGALALAPYIVPYFDDYVPHWVSIAALLLSPLGAIIHQDNLHAD